MIFSNDIFMRAERTIVVSGTNSTIYVGLIQDKRGFALTFVGELIMEANGFRGKAKTMHLWDNTTPYSLTQAKKVYNLAADIIMHCGMRPKSELNPGLWEKAIGEINKIRDSVFGQLPPAIQRNELSAA